MAPTSSPSGPSLLAGRYELLGRLGSGGMADVYRARDTLLGRDVALKVFRDSSTESTFDARQQAEIGLLARLNHPGLVMIFDAGTGVLDGAARAFLVIELVQGPSLADRLGGGPLPPTQTALVGTQVAESLAYIHEAGIVHRDVKPANILLPGDTRSGATEAWAKLTDFGIARLVDEARLTSTGTLLGTPSYLSPEQATGTVLGPPTDVYALGLVLLECLTGERVFPGTVLESVAARLDHDPVVPAELGPVWVALLTSMTTREPASRPTAIEASAELRRLVAVPDPTRALVAFSIPSAATRSTAARRPGDATQLLTGLPAGTLTFPPGPRSAPSPAATQILTGGVPSTRGLAGPPAVTPIGRPAGTSGPAFRVPRTARVPRARRAVAARVDRLWSSKHRNVVLGTLALVIGVVVALLVGLSGGGAALDPAPSYPAVPGQLGVNLERLQESVTP